MQDGDSMPVADRTERNETTQRAKFSDAFRLLDDLKGAFGHTCKIPFDLGVLRFGVAATQRLSEGNLTSGF